MSFQFFSSLLFDRADCRAQMQVSQVPSHKETGGKKETSMGSRIQGHRGRVHQSLLSVGYPVPLENQPGSVQFTNTAGPSLGA